MAKSDHGKPAREGWNPGYDKAWLKVYGEVCPYCKGTGVVDDTIHSVQAGIDIDKPCPNCDGIGYMEKKK